MNGKELDANGAKDYYSEKERNQLTYANALPHISRGWELVVLNGYLLDVPKYYPPIPQRKSPITTFTLVRRYGKKGEWFAVRHYCEIWKKREQDLLARLQPRTGLSVSGEVKYVRNKRDEVVRIIVVNSLQLWVPAGTSEQSFLEGFGLTPKPEEIDNGNSVDQLTSALS